MTPRRTRIVAIVLLATLVLPLLAGCGAPAAKPAGEPTKVAPASEGEPAAPVAPAKPSSGGGDAQARVSEAFGVLTGTGGDPSVFPSYHIEVKGSGPALDWKTQEVKTDVTDIKADVQGKNIHLFYAGNDGETTEGYVIDDGEDETEYEVQDGMPQESFGISLAWATWPLGVIIPLTLAAIGAQPAGGEAIDGRQAEVYDIDMAKGDQTVRAMVQSMLGKGYTAAKGKAWVDQETGALLKLVLDYEEDIYDPSSDDKDAPPLGHGSGHYDIVVTQVGKVSVSLP